MARPKKRSKTKKILFAVEIIVLLVFIGGLYVYGQLMSRMDKTNTQKLDTEKVQVNEEVQDAINSEDSHLTGYTTYALFGIDSRSANMKFSGNQNSDTMIIASVNNDTKEVKLVSVYRDTLLNLGNDTYSKANAAYAYGGPEQAITMLNTNLDLNITDYATVKFDALATIIDDLGGLDMDMSYAEIVHMNNYCVETAEDTGLSYTPIELPEKPEVIILDEPTVGLDPKQIIEIRDLIKSLKKKHTVILSSHILSEVSAVCDYVLIISHGKLVASDTPENLGKLAEGSNTLNLLVKGDKDHIRIALGQISDIKDIKIEDAKEEHAWNVMLSTKEDMDIREEVFFKMADAHCPILEMQSKKVSLEEIFLELTEDDKKKKNEKETDKKEGEDK